MKYIIVCDGVEIGTTHRKFAVGDKILTKAGLKTVESIGGTPQFTYMYVS